MDFVFFAMGAGFLAGAIHVLMGADHLAAVAVFAAREKVGAWRSGLLWGAGHAIGASLVALLALGVRGVVSAELLSSWGERLVGVVLLAVGFWGLKKRRSEPVSEGHPTVAFGVGTLHGVSGASHFIGLLPALLLPDRASAVGYLTGFAGGTILAMIGFAVTVGLAGRSLMGRGERFYRSLLTGCSLASIGVGCFWIWSGFNPH